MSDAWTWHGGALAAAQRYFGGTDWIDLSTGINPHPWPSAADTRRMTLMVFILVSLIALFLLATDLLIGAGLSWLFGL